jgi:hypothetical protein
MLHLQRTVPNWDEALRLGPERALLKTVDQSGQNNVAKAINPNIKTCLRHWYDPQQVFGGTFEENKTKARVFLDTFIDGTFIMHHAQYTDFIEDWNEYLANSQNAQEIEHRVTWARALAWVWKNEYRYRTWIHEGVDYGQACKHIRLVLCNTAIGNWIHRDFAVVARDYDCAMGYHPYTAWGWETPKERWEFDWVYLSGLWDTMEFDWGIEVDWVFTEAGPFQSAIDGWRSDNCLGFDRDLYVHAMREWIKDVQQTPAYKEGRIVGWATYTVGRVDSVWKHYWTEQPELNMLANMYKQEWNPGTPPPPVDPPPPDDCFGEPREQYHRVYHVIPSDTPIDVATEIFARLWAERPTTVGPSYDDAGIGALNTKDAVLHLLDESVHEEFDEWFALEYPGTAVTFADVVEPPQLIELHSPVAGIPLLITHPFNEPRDYDGDGIKDDLHEGLDIRAVDSDWEPVLVVAPADGVVEKVREIDSGTGYGKYARIDHGNGLKTWLCHLESLFVTEGIEVKTGDVIGLAGTTGNSTGIHLHLTLQWVGHGLSGYVIDDVIDPTPLLVDEFETL